jgi:hypothetical protein
MRRALNLMRFDNCCHVKMLHFSLSLSLSVALQPFGLWPLFQFLNLYTVGRTPWTGDQRVARPLPKHSTTQRE